MRQIDVDAVVARAGSRDMRRMQYETFALMEPSTNMNLDFLRQMGEPEQLDYTSVRTIVGSFAELAAPRTYLEIGTRRGHSLCMFARCAPEPADVYSFDLWMEGYAGEANPGEELIRRELGKLGFPGRIQFFPGDSKETVPAFFADPAHPQQVDCVFVDGDHSDEGARTDIRNVMDRISPGGLLVFDDITHPQHRTLLGVWNDLMEGRPEFDVRVNTRHEYGWAIALRRA